MGRSKGRQAVSRKLLILVTVLLALVMVPFVAWNGLVEEGNAAAYDMLLRLSPTRDSGARSRIVLLAIDDATVSRYGPLPLNRATLAKALDRISSGGPSVLVVDMLLSERTQPDADASLAKSFSQFPKVVLACALEAGQNNESSQWIRPLPEFQRHAFAVGHVHFEPDRDGVARTLLLTKANLTERYWALGFEAFRAVLGTRGPPTEYTNELAVDNRRIPVTNAKGRLLWIHYDGPEGTFTRVSLASVLEGRTPPSTFAGKVVILGVTAQGAGDHVYTPFSVGMGMSGIEIHANIFSTLLDGAYLKPLRPVSESLWLVGIVGLIITAAWVRDGRFLAPVAIAGLLLLPLFAYWMLREGTIFPLASALGVQVTTSLLCYLAHSRFTRNRLGEAIVRRQDYAFRLQAIAHEIKTPLTAIHASSQLIADVDVPEQKKEEIAQRIHKESGRLAGVVTTFLDVERISAGVLKLQRRDVQLSEVISDACDRARLLAAKKRISIQQEIDPVSVPADGDLLQFAIYNLLVNAIKYSPDQSSIRVSIRFDARTASVVVADQGCGIDPAEQTHIFERFYRAKKDDEANSKAGSGVGLALVKEIITQHGGTIKVQSQPGFGSTFSISLPREVEV